MTSIRLASGHNEPAFETGIEAEFLLNGDSGSLAGQGLARAVSRDREAVLALANEGRLLDTAVANIRDPYVLEFLGLPERQAYSESDLEHALVAHLQEG